jgi:hypothetical protein
MGRNHELSFHFFQIEDYRTFLIGQTIKTVPTMLPQSSKLPSIKQLFEGNQSPMSNCFLPAILSNHQTNNTKKNEVVLHAKKLPLKPLKMKTSPLQNKSGTIVFVQEIIQEPKIKEKKPAWVFEENVLANRGRRGVEKEWQKKIKKFYKK